MKRSSQGMDEGRRVSECSYAMIALIDTIRYDEREQAVARRSSSIVHRVRVRGRSKSSLVTTASVFVVDTKS